jgi:hypothetical protein
VAVRPHRLHRRERRHPLRHCRPHRRRRPPRRPAALAPFPAALIAAACAGFGGGGREADGVGAGEERRGDLARRGDGGDG